MSLSFKQSLHSDTELARETRFARWQLEAAKHYANRYDYLAVTTEPAESAHNLQVFELKNGSSSSQVVPASGSSGGTESSVPSVSSSSGEKPQKSLLLQSVAAAQTTLSVNESAWKEQEALIVASMKLTAPPQVHVQAGNISSFMVISLFVTLTAFCSIGYWIQSGLHTRGSYQPKEVANQLSLQGLPLVGVIAGTSAFC